MRFATLYNMRNTDPIYTDRPFGWVDWYKGNVSQIAFEPEPFLWEEGYTMEEMIDWLKTENAPSRIFKQLQDFDMVQVELTIITPPQNTTNDQKHSPAKPGQNW